MKHFCPNVPIILVGNKKDLRNDEHTRRELAKMKQVSYFCWKHTGMFTFVSASLKIITLSLTCASRNQLNMRTARRWQTASVPTATRNVLPKPKMVWGKSLRWQLGRHCRPRNVARSPPVFCYRLWETRGELLLSTDGGAASNEIWHGGEYWGGPKKKVLQTLNFGSPSYPQ